VGVRGGVLWALDGHCDNFLSYIGAGCHASVRQFVLTGVERRQRICKPPLPPPAQGLVTIKITINIPVVYMARDVIILM
jgi:hypothetical protein